MCIRDSFELEGGGRNLHGKMHLGDVGRGIKERSLHQGSDVALHFAASARFQIFHDGIAGQKIGWLYIAIAAAGPDLSSSALDFDL